MQRRVDLTIQEVIMRARQFVTVILLVSIVSCVTSGVVLAQEPPKPGSDSKARKPAEADKKTASLLDRVDQLTYAVEDKVKKVTLKGEVSISGVMWAKAKKGTFTYSWDTSSNKKPGSISYSDPIVERAALQSGLDTDMLDRMFRVESWKVQFAGCTLTSTESSGVTTVHVEGDDKDGTKSITLGEHGMPIEKTAEAKMGGQTITAVLKLEYVGLSGRYAPSVLNMTMTGPGMPKMEQRLTFEYREVDGHHVLEKHTFVRKMGDNEINKMSVTLSDYKFTEETAKKKDTKPEEPRE